MCHDEKQDFHVLTVIRISVISIVSSIIRVAVTIGVHVHPRVLISVPTMASSHCDEERQDDGEKKDHWDALHGGFVD